MGMSFAISSIINERMAFRTFSRFSSKVLIIEIYTPSMAIFEELLMLKGANSLALEFKSSYFAVDHLRLLREFFCISAINLFLFALRICSRCRIFLQYCNSSL